MRIAKYISNAGICSRRDAEKLILKGKVLINNSICNQPNTNIDLKDKIKINNKLIKINNIIRLWKMYKPIKILCTNKDPNKRRTVFDLMPKNFPRVISIGRLDYMSEGLLLFTNNGDFARKLELPSSNFLRKYRLCLKNKIDNKDIRIINKGVTISGINYNKIKIKVEKKNDKYTWLIINLFEGKNREIRNICKHFKWQIIKLIRIQYASISLEKQKPGQIIEVKNFSSIL
tara:strand:+ start:280 stop:972 length:693 start_codon:yes stop_codon:yes gene_type:complete